jgi:large repetitive protein
MVTPYTVTYDGSAHTAAVTSITGVCTETGNTVGTVDVSNTTHTNAGTYSSDYWTFAGTTNYNSITVHQTITDKINMATPSFSGLTASQTISCGTLSISLAGKLSAGAGPTQVAPVGQMVTITVDGTGATSTAIAGNAGNFSATVDTHAVPAGTHTITYHYGGDSTNFNAAVDNTSTSLTVNDCIVNTTLTVAAASGECGGTVNLSATLTKTSDSSFVSGKTITFTLNNITVGTGITNGSGVATKSGVSISGISVGTHSSAIGASFAGDSGFAMSSGSAQLTVVDTTKPVIPVLADVTGQCSATIAAAPTTTDSCAGTITGTTSDPLTRTTQGTSVVTWTFDDGNGNSVTATQNIVVKDTMPPMVACKDATVFLDANGNASISESDVVASKSDNCGTPTITLSKSAFTCTNLGVNPVTVTADDGHGNTASCIANVTVIDNTPPTVVCKNATVYLDANGNASITESDVVDSKSDNCGTPTISLSQTAFTCADKGNNTVTVTATDGSGNTSSCTATVTVVDNMKPVITQCAADQTITAACPPASTLVSDFTAGVIATDNCGAVTVTQTPAAGTAVAVGDTTVTLHVKDTSNNEATCSATLSVHYNFTGFFQPVDNIPIYNKVKAGSAIPVKFSLGCYQGLNIFAAGFPLSGLIVCDSHDPIDDIETTVTAGGSSLNYDAVANQYIYVWKTDKTWTGCRALNVKLADGTSHIAYFTFTK